MIENRQLITSAIAEKMTKKAKSVLEPQLVSELGDIDNVESREDHVGENAETLLRTQPRRVMSPTKLQSLSIYVYVNVTS